MGELIRVAPIVDIRETFVPSERLRIALVDYLLDPDLDRKTAESLRAAFLFKSWRRRAVEREDYLSNANGINDLVQAASLDFTSFATKGLRFDGRIGINPQGTKKRFVFGAMSHDDSLTRFGDLLDDIPTIEDAKKANIGRSMVYVDIAIRSLVSGRYKLREAVGRIHDRLIYPAEAGTYYITPDRIIAEETMFRIKSTSDDSLEIQNI